MKTPFIDIVAQVMIAIYSIEDKDEKKEALLSYLENLFFYILSDSETIDRLIEPNMFSISSKDNLSYYLPAKHAKEILTHYRNRILQ